MCAGILIVASQQQVVTRSPQFVTVIQAATDITMRDPVHRAFGKELQRRIDSVGSLIETDQRSDSLAFEVQEPVPRVDVFDGCRNHIRGLGMVAFVG
jgi:hypothetical protein